MSRTLQQIFTDNPITTNESADLMYFARSPYTAGNDTGMLFSDFAAQFGSPIVPAALTRTNDTNVTVTLGGTPTTALLQATSLTLGWTGQLSPARGGTGVNNGTSTLTLGGNLATSGAFASTFTMTAATAVTFPNSGTLATTTQLPTPAALTKTDDTNVTLTLGGTPATALLQATSLTLGWTGTLSGTRGGTGVNNGANTATYAGNLSFASSFTTSGAFAVTQTYTGITNVTFPTSGTLATTSQIPTGAALTKTDDTNVTLTLGGSPTTALVNAASLTLGWTGQLGLTRGGTAASITASNGGIVYSTASALAVLSGTATAGQLLTSGSNTTPAWTTSTYPLTNAVNTLLYASSANTMAALPTANSSVLVTGSGGVPSLSTTLPTNLAMQTPASLTLTNATGLPISGITGLGTGVGTALAANSLGSGGISLETDGTFTPVLAFGGASVGITYTSQQGVYRRIGNTVTINIFIILSAVGSSSGAATISGLPFAQSAAISVSSLTMVPGITFTAGQIPVAGISGASSTIFLQIINPITGAGANLTNTNFSNTSLIIVSGTYLI
jgi:hypothetical protein